MIARNGGSIEAENKLANTGAVLGLLNEEEKLKISAKEIEVKHLEDKDKYENKGGGISVGFDGMKPKVPNVSIIHDKVDKEQINRATTINTEITLNGEKVEAEDLGFNTDLEKAQEKAKDEEKHLNAKLHTDLLNESEKNKLKYAAKKIVAFATEANDTNKFKESLFGIAVDKYKDENQKQFNLIKDENLTEQQILKTATDIVIEFFKSIGYKGKIPEINLTNQEKSFSVDSLDKETGERRTEKVYFSIAQIRDKNLDFSQLMTHELAHMNTYNEGFLGEETALHTRRQVGSENKNKKMSEKEKAEYLAKIENRYESKDINKMYEEANQVAEIAKEYYMSPEDLAYRKKHMGSHIPNEVVDAGISFIFDLSPAGDTKGVVEALHGKDLITGEELGFLTRIIGALPIMNDIASAGKLIKVVKVAGKTEALLNDGTRVALNATEVAKYEDSVKASSNITDSIKVEKIQDTTKVIDKTDKVNAKQVAGYIPYRNIEPSLNKQINNTLGSISIEDASEIAAISTEWKTGMNGKNQGIVHFFEYNEKFPDRIPNIEKQLGLEKGTFNNSVKGYKSFTEEAKEIIKKSTKNGNYGIFPVNGEIKGYFYLQGVNKGKEGVLIITKDGKIDTVMKSNYKYFNQQIKKESGKLMEVK